MKRSDGLRTCITCHKTKPLAEFNSWYSNIDNRIYYRTDCKVCHGNATGKYMREHPDIKKAYTRKYRLQRVRKCIVCNTLKTNAEFPFHKHYCRDCGAEAMLQRQKEMRLSKLRKAL